MAFIKPVKSKYSNEKDVLELAYYMGDVSKSPHSISGGRNTIGSIFIEPEIIAEQFFAVQWATSLFYKRQGKYQNDYLILIEKK